MSENNLFAFIYINYPVFHILLVYVIDWCYITKDLCHISQKNTIYIYTILFDTITTYLTQSITEWHDHSSVVRFSKQRHIRDNQFLHKPSRDM